MFRRLEEESAHRAQQEEEREQSQAATEGRPIAQDVADNILPNLIKSTVKLSSVKHNLRPCTDMFIPQYAGGPLAKVRLEFLHVGVISLIITFFFLSLCLSCSFLVRPGVHQ